MVAQRETPKAEKQNTCKGGLKLAEYHVGVDVSKRKHKACIRNLSQDSYSGVFSFNIDRQGFEKFLGTLEKLSQNKEDFLLSHGYTVVEINPYRANQFRKAKGEKAKTDRIDARSLAGLLSLENHKSLSIPDPVIDNLRELTRFRADMVKDRTALVNQLHETLSPFSLNLLLFLTSSIPLPPSLSL